MSWASMKAFDPNYYIFFVKEIIFLASDTKKINRYRSIEYKTELRFKGDIYFMVSKLRKIEFKNSKFILLLNSIVYFKKHTLKNKSCKLWIFLPSNQISAAILVFWSYLT